MKHILMILGPAVLGMTLTAFGQTAESKAPPAGPNQPPAAQTQGRGRGGAPFAWGDQNKDGICDVTGRPVGQGRGMAQAQGRGGWGGGRMARAAGRGRQNMRGCGCCRGAAN